VQCNLFYIPEGGELDILSPP